MKRGTGLLGALVLAAGGWGLVAAGRHGENPRVARSHRREQRPGVPRTDRTGTVRAVRLAELVGRASYVGPDPRFAYEKFRRHWRKIPDPYGDLPSDRAFLRLKVAFRYPDVAHYLDRRYPRSREALGAGDRKWTYAHGVYDSATALFCPTDGNRTTQLEFPVTVPRGAVLDFGVGALIERDRVGRLEMAIDVTDGSGRRERVWSRTLTHAEALMWHRERVGLGAWGGRRVLLRLSCRGKGAAGLWQDPEIWAPGPRPPYNVLFLVVDTMRPDAISALGGRYAKTPNMDRLVREGTRFVSCYSNGAWTRTSMVAFFSANLASAVGLASDRFSLPLGAKPRFYNLRPPQFPHHMVGLGYAVLGVVDNFFASPYADIGVDHDFPSLVDIRHPHLATKAITRRAVLFLRRHRDRPFFLYVHYEALHDYDRNTRRLAAAFGDLREPDLYRRAYLELARRVDRAIGQVVKALDELGLARRTLVILTADHGEVFDPRHAHHVPYFGQSMWHQHARSVWDEVAHIPMVWRMPGKVPAGREVRAQVRAMDLFPSVLDFLGLPPMRRVAGKSYAAALRGGQVEDRPVVTEGFHIVGLRHAGFKYIRRDWASRRFVANGRLWDKPEELFDLREDPAEVRDVAARHPDRLQRMRRLLDELVRQARRAAQPAEGTGARPAVAFRACPGEGHSLSLEVWQERGGAPAVLGLSGGVSAEVEGASGPGGFQKLRVVFHGRDGRGCGTLVADFGRPVSFRANLDGRALDETRVRLGGYGLPVARAFRLAPWEEHLVWPQGMPPASVQQQAGTLLVWSTDRAIAYQDPDAQRRRAMARRLVRMNLLRGGYVKGARR